MLVGAIPFGLLFGALATAAGLPLWATLATSLLVYAGSAQFIAVGLVSQGTAVALIIATTFIVNARHALYAASLVPHLKHLRQRWLVPLAFTLTDETYAVTIPRYNRADNSPNKHWFQLGSAAAMYSNWQLCTLLGALAGAQFQGLADIGLEVAMAVTFIGIVVPLLRSAPMLLSAVTAGVVALLCNGLPHQLGLFIGAIAGILAGFTLEQRRGASRSEPS